MFFNSHREELNYSIYLSKLGNHNISNKKMSNFYRLISFVAILNSIFEHISIKRQLPNFSSCCVFEHIKNRIFLKRMYGQCTYLIFNFLEFYKYIYFLEIGKFTVRDQNTNEVQCTCYCIYQVSIKLFSIKIKFFLASIFYFIH